MHEDADNAVHRIGLRRMANALCPISWVAIMEWSLLYGVHVADCSFSGAIELRLRRAK
jgi:hypothetical protein